METLTNILATLVVAIVTNEYHPKQYQEMWYVTTGPEQVEKMGVWRNASDWHDFGNQLTRDNPDKKIAEVREIRKLVFDAEGKREIILSDRLLSKQEFTRVVRTEEEWKAGEIEVSRAGSAVTNVMVQVTNFLSSVEVVGVKEAGE